MQSRGCGCTLQPRAGTGSSQAPDLSRGSTLGFKACTVQQSMGLLLRSSLPWLMDILRLRNTVDDNGRAMKIKNERTKLNSRPEESLKLATKNTLMVRAIRGHNLSHL